MTTEILTILTPDDFITPSYRLIFENYRNLVQSDTKFDASVFSQNLSAELRPVYDELYLYASTVEQSDEKYLLRLTLEYKKMLIAQRMQSLSKQSEDDVDDGMSKLNADMVAVEKRLKLL